MGVAVSKRVFKSELRGSTELNFLYGCIGEKIQVVNDLYFSNLYVMSNDNLCTTNPPQEISGQIDNDNIVLFQDNNYLNTCQVGDVLIFATSFGGTPISITATLTEIINGGLGRFDYTFLYAPINIGFVANITQLKSVIYQYGLGTGGYNSKIDNSVQKGTLNSISKLDSITANLELIGNKDWQFDTIELVGLGDSEFTTKQNIRITHTFVVGPMFLTGELSDIYNQIAPARFKPDNEIKYSSEIFYLKNAVDTSDDKLIQFEGIGQFGWFNTKYNGQPSPYKLASLQFKRVSDSEIVNQLEYNEVEVKFILNSSTSSFTNTTPLVFGFNFLPDDDSFYQNTGRTQDVNYCFDSKIVTANNTTINGNFFGTSKQIIKTIKANTLTSSTCEVTVRILIGSAQKTILEQADLANYSIWCIVENTTLDPLISDKSNVLIDVNYIYVQKTKIDLLDNDTLFIEHPYDTLQYSVEELEMFPVDDVVANSLITLDYTGLEDDGILLKSVRPQILLTHATEADIILDGEFISLENYPLIGSLPSVQNITFQKDRAYKIENGIRKTITMYRNYSLDVGNTKAWLLSFPFMNRWEYWIKVLGFNDIPEDLFDNTVPFYGANNLWNRLANISGWSLVYRTTFDIVQNGENFEQVFEKELTSTNFNSNTDWSDCVIESHDIDTDDEIIVGPKKYVYAQKNTLIRAKFTKSTGIVPDLEGVYAVIWAESFEGGGITEIRNIDSGRDVISTSCFTGINGMKRVSITKNINTFTCEAILDFSKLPSGQKITVYARIYEYASGGPEDGRVTEDFILRMTLDGQIRLV